MAVKDLPRETKFGQKKIKNAPIKKKNKNSNLKNRKKRVLNVGNRLFGCFNKMYKKALLPDMQFLGIIRAIHDYEIKISLPGRLIGTLPMTNISEEFNQLLVSYTKDKENINDDVLNLRHYFNVGQWMAVQIIENDGKNIVLTCNPKCINANISLKDIHKNMTLCCTIKSIEDHGYILETGLPIKAFLPEKEAKKYIKYWKRSLNLSVGQYLICTINLAIESSLENGNLPKYLPVTIYNGLNDIGTTVVKKQSNTTKSHVIKTLQSVFKKYCESSFQPLSADSILPGSVLPVMVMKQNTPLGNTGYEISSKFSNNGFLPSPSPWPSLLPSALLNDDQIGFIDSKNYHHVQNIMEHALITLVFGKFVNCNNNKDSNIVLPDFPTKATIFPAIVTYYNPFSKAFAVTIAPHLLKSILLPQKAGLANCAVDYTIANINETRLARSPFKPRNTFFRSQIGTIIKHGQIVQITTSKTNMKNHHSYKFSKTALHLNAETLGIYATFQIEIPSFKSVLNNKTSNDNSCQTITVLGFGLDHSSFNQMTPHEKPHKINGQLSKNVTKNANSDGNNNKKVGDPVSARIIDFDAFLGIAILDYNYQNKTWTTKIKTNLSSQPTNGTKSNNMNLKDKAALINLNPTLIENDSIAMPIKPEFTLTHIDNEKKWIVEKNEWSNYYSVALGAIIHGCVVMSYVEGEGVCVKINSHIRGFIPMLHLSDGPYISKSDESRLQKYRKQYYQPGKMLTCRVVSVLPELTKLVLTHKKSLIDTAIEPLTSFDDIIGNDDNNIHKVVQGWIVQIKDGILVGFYGQMKGWLPYTSPRVLPELATEQALYPDCLTDSIEERLKRFYYVGQVIVCRIIDVIPKTRKIYLELMREEYQVPKLNPSNEITKEQSDIDVDNINDQGTNDFAEIQNIGCAILGEFYSGHIFARTNAGFQIILQHAAFSNHWKLDAILPFSQLSDHPDNCDFLASQLTIGTSLEFLMCIAIRPRVVMTNREMFKQIIRARHSTNIDQAQNISDYHIGDISKITLPLPKTKSINPKYAKLLAAHYNNTTYNPCIDTVKDLLPDTYVAGTLKSILPNVGLLIEFPDGKTTGLAHKSKLPLPIKKFIVNMEKSKFGKTNHNNDDNIEAEDNDFNLAIGRTIVAKVAQITQEIDPKLKKKKYRISLTLAIRDLHDRNHISFGDKGASLLSHYLTPRYKHTQNYLKSIGKTFIEPGTIMPKCQNIYLKHNKDANADTENLHWYLVDKDETNGFLIVAYVSPTYNDSTQKTNDYQDIIILYPEHLLECNQYFSNFPFDYKVMTYSASKFLKEETVTKKEFGGFAGTLLQEIKALSQLKAPIPATVIGFGPLTYPLTRKCINFKDKNINNPQIIPLGSKLDQDCNKGHNSPKLYAIVLLQIELNGRKLNKKFHTKTRSSKNSSKETVIEYIPAYLPLYWDYCDLVPKLRLQKEYEKGEVIHIIIEIYQPDNINFTDFPIIIVRKTEDMKILPSKINGKPISKKLKVDNKLEHTPDSQISFFSPKLIQHSNVFANDKTTYQVVRKSPTFLTLQPNGARLYIDELYKRYFASSDNLSQDTSNIKVMSQFVLGHKFPANDLEIKGVRNYVIKKKMVLSSPGYITEVPILRFKIPDHSLISEKPFKLDEKITTCFVESVQDDKRRIFLFFKMGVRGVCKDIDISINKKIVTEPRFAFKPGHVCKTPARIIGIISQKNNLKQSNLSPINDTNNKSNNFREKVKLDHSKASKDVVKIMANSDESTKLPCDIIYKVSFVHSSFDSDHAMPLQSSVCARFLTKLPNHCYLYQLPRNKFGIASVFELQQESFGLVSTLTHEPRKNSIVKCRIITNLSSFASNFQANAERLEKFCGVVRRYITLKNQSSKVDSVMDYMKDIYLISTNKGNSGDGLHQITEYNNLRDHLKLGDVLTGIGLQSYFNKESNSNAKHPLKVLISQFPKIVCIVGDAPIYNTQNLDELSTNVVTVKITDYASQETAKKLKSDFALIATFIEEETFVSEELSIKNKVNDTTVNDKPSHPQEQFNTAEKSNLEDRETLHFVSKEPSPDKRYDWWDTNMTPQNGTSKIYNSSDPNQMQEKTKLLKGFPKYDHGSLVKDEEPIDQKSDHEENHISKRAQKRAIEKLETETFLQQNCPPSTDENKINSLHSNALSSISEQELERAVLARPNDSLLWTKYVAYYVGLNQIAKARDTICRALKTISFREEQEKLNIWATRLNLELMLSLKMQSTTTLTNGITPSDKKPVIDELSQDFEDTLQEALKSNDPKKIYMLIIKIYISNHLYQRTEETFKHVLNLDPESPHYKASHQSATRIALQRDFDLWAAYTEYLMKNVRKPAAARQILEKSFVHLDPKHHIEMIVKFALLEFDHGHVERGKTMFQKVLKNYPKRTDVWFRYIDALIKRTFIQDAKHVLQEMITLKFDKRARRAIYKKLVDFEVKYGQFDNLEAIKESFSDVAQSVN